MVDLRGSKAPNWLAPGTHLVDPAINDFTLSDEIQAGFAQENFTLNFFESWMRNTVIHGAHTPENYNPFEEVIGTEYEPYAEEFIQSINPTHTALIKQAIDEELKNRRTLALSGGVLGSLLGGTLDPVNLIPFAGIASRATGLFKIGQRTTRLMNIVDRARFGALDASLGATAAEIGLQNMQRFRTREESFQGVAASAVFGGIIGGISGAFVPGRKIQPPNIGTNPTVVIHGEGAALFEGGRLFDSGEELTEGDFRGRPLSPEEMEQRLTREGFIQRELTQPEINQLENYAMAYAHADTAGKRFLDEIVHNDAKVKINNLIETKTPEIPIIPDEITASEKAVLDDYKPVYEALPEEQRAQVDAIMPASYKAHLEAVQRAAVDLEFEPIVKPDEIQLKQELDRIASQENLAPEEMSRAVDELLDEYGDEGNFGTRGQPELRSPLQRTVEQVEDEINDLRLQIDRIESRMEDAWGREYNQLKKERSKLKKKVKKLRREQDFSRELRTEDSPTAKEDNTSSILGSDEIARVNQAYLNMVQESGFGTVEIAFLSQRSGVPLDKLKKYLLEGRPKGETEIHFGDWHHSTDEIRAGVIEEDGEKYLLARILNAEQTDLPSSKPGVSAETVQEPSTQAAPATVKDFLTDEPNIRERMERFRRLKEINERGPQNQDELIEQILSYDEDEFIDEFAGTARPNFYKRMAKLVPKGNPGLEEIELGDGEVAVVFRNKKGENVAIATLSPSEHAGFDEPVMTGIAAKDESLNSARAVKNIVDHLINRNAMGPESIEDITPQAAKLIYKTAQRVRSRSDKDMLQVLIVALIPMAAGAQGESDG